MIRSSESCSCPIREFGPSVAEACPSQFLLFMTILQTFINGRCDLADPCRRVREPKLEESYDFVVIGGGTAGAVVAGRLSENPNWKVLVIEAGGDEPTAAAVPGFLSSYWGRDETDWNYETLPQRNACLQSNGVCSWPRGKMLGGCSSINGMMYMRGRQADFDNWTNQGCTGWTWQDVLPFYLRSEDNREVGRVNRQLHRAGGPMPVQRFSSAPELAYDIVQASLELGYPVTEDLNSEGTGGFTIAQTMHSNGTRFSTAKAFLRPASRRPNLHVLLNAQVTKVIIDPQSKTVTGVEYYKNGITKTVRVRREAIISGGTLNTPQILMLSGIGPAEVLQQFNIAPVQNLPGVGQNLLNHIGVELDFTLQNLPVANSLTWATALDYMLERTGPLASSGMAQVTGIVNSRYAASHGRHPDLQLFFYGIYSACSDGTVTENREGSDPESLSVSVILLHPQSSGYMTLRSADPLDKPLFQPNYFMFEQDLDVIVDGVRLAYRLANTTILRDKYGMERKAGFGRECPGDGPVPTDEHIKCLAKRYTAPENHQVGSAKMGPKDDPMAVVDSRLKVYGIKGLRVADASVFPTVISGNTAATTIMIGERCADFIKNDHRQKVGHGYHYRHPESNWSYEDNQGERWNQNNNNGRWNQDNNNEGWNQNQDNNNGRWNQDNNNEGWNQNENIARWNAPKNNDFFQRSFQKK